MCILLTKSRVLKSLRVRVSCVLIQHQCSYLETVLILNCLKHCVLISCSMVLCSYKLVLRHVVVMSAILCVRYHWVSAILHVRYLVCPLSCVSAILCVRYLVFRYLVCPLSCVSAILDVRYLVCPLSCVSAISCCTLSWSYMTALFCHINLFHIQLNESLNQDLLVHSLHLAWPVSSDSQNFSLRVKYPSLFCPHKSDLWK